MLTTQQLEVVETFLSRKKLLLQADTSFGKTLTFLKIVDYLITLIPDFRAVFITDTRVRDADGVVQQYQQWKHLLPNLTLNEEGKIEGVEVFAYSNLKGLANLGKCDFLCLDESQKIKEHKTLRFKSISNFVKKSKPIYRLCMTATPIANGIIDIWSQIWILDEGKRLDKITHFLQEYFEKETKFGYVQFVEKTGATAVILESIADVFLKVETPRPAKFEEHIITYELDPQNYQIYKMLENQGLIYSHKETALKVKEILTKLRQFTFGLVKISRTDKIVSATDIEKTLKLKKSALEINIEVANTRYHRLKDIIDKAIMHTNIIIFTHYIAEAEFLLKKLLVDYPEKRIVRIAGGENKNVFAEILESWNEKKINILICNPASVGTGLNLQYGGHGLIWNTSSFSYVSQYQANSRLIRHGQTEMVRIYYLACKNTIDEKILKVLQSKQNLKDLMRSMIQ